jgi:hypothetical protein
MNLGQVAKDKNLLLVVEKNLVMNEIQNLSTWLSKDSNGGACTAKCRRYSVSVRVCRRLKGRLPCLVIANHCSGRRTYHIAYI